ncbi:hypothetical protein ABZT06_31820 [Streptomyces sp. NPDC005483]|uniref:hypothetical protein n=1 Tax=Streptomyces sp. NPDC005483 TaxID=3154882 RepID=UPI0033A26F39
MINDTALLESKSLRDSVLERTDVLDRVKALSLLPDGMHVTTAMVASYFGWVSKPSSHWSRTTGQNWRPTGITC